ncbi:MAG: hypothetical protein V1859_03145 [archaeon]
MDKKKAAVKKPFYKELLKCKICQKRYSIDKNADIYLSKYAKRTYCKECYQKYLDSKP